MENGVERWWWCWLNPARTLYCVEDDNGGCHGGVWQVWEWVETIEHCRVIYRSGVSVWVWFWAPEISWKVWLTFGRGRPSVNSHCLSKYFSRLKIVGITLPMRWHYWKRKKGALGRMNCRGEEVAGVRWWQGGTGREKRRKKRDAKWLFCPFLSFELLIWTGAFSSFPDKTKIIIKGIIYILKTIL
jgi:hypothetical protein